MRWEHTNVAVTPGLALVKKFQTNPVLSAGFPRKLGKWFTKVNQAMLETGSLPKSAIKNPTHVGIMRLNTRLPMGAALRRHVVNMSGRRSLNTSRGSTKAQAVKAAEQKAVAGEDRTGDLGVGLSL